jgi:hypothetical protein
MPKRPENNANDGSTAMPRLARWYRAALAWYRAALACWRALPKKPAPYIGTLSNTDIDAMPVPHRKARPVAFKPDTHVPAYDKPDVYPSGRVCCHCNYAILSIYNSHKACWQCRQKTHPRRSREGRGELVVVEQDYERLMREPVAVQVS